MRPLQISSLTAMKRMMANIGWAVLALRMEPLQRE